MGADSVKTDVKTCWRFVVRHREGFVDAQAAGLKGDIADLGIRSVENVEISPVYYCTGSLKAEQVNLLQEKLLCDPITQHVECREISLSSGASGKELHSLKGTSIEVGFRPGVRDPVEDSLKNGAAVLGIQTIGAVHTAVLYTLAGNLSPRDIERICEKLLVNPTIQMVITAENLRQVVAPLQAAPMAIETVHLLQANDTVLQRISLDHQLSLNLEEMKAVQAYYRSEGREPALIELETIAQTWSEHCKHKTFRGPIVYTEEVDGKTEKRVINDLLKTTIMKATEELAKPWCISVFSDNSGVIAFDDQYHACFKVETHNHPSALEPFGGANTGIGGVIRDILGTGLGAKPVASTDVFCFAPPDLPSDRVPPGVLHPRRVIKGVVSGVRDYGNKMGIPTVNGAVLFDERFVGNPLVYCGNVGLLPKDKVAKKVEPGMAVVVAGGRTGRDGIHGATFSSLALTHESEVLSSTAVQIGDPITEKKLTDALLEAQAKGLYSSVTDCGAGGLSSAVGEMGSDCGAQIDLEKAPLKYAGLTPAEIWISESQERMIFAVPQENLEKLTALFKSRDVEAVAIGTFTDSGRLELFYKGNRVGELKMGFLHHGVPKVLRPARWVSPRVKELQPSQPADLAAVLLNLLSWWDTCSKEWIIRCYDHEVQGGSVLKPLVGAQHQGPSDAAVINPRLGSPKGLVLSNGINFRYGDIDPYWMAVLAIEEAIRQIVAVGGSPDQIAVLDNFCWGDPTRVEVLGSLVRASFGCYDAAKAFGTPFISGKDSLHNEYRTGEKTIQIPGTLLISAIGVISDIKRVVSMDAKKAGNALYIVGLTKSEMGGSSYYASLGIAGGSVPQVDLKRAPELLKAVSGAIGQGLVVSAHDCSEGGIGVAAAEMAFSGKIGLSLDLRRVPQQGIQRDDLLLFAESASRFLLEVPPDKEEAFRKALQGVPVDRIGQFEKSPLLRVTGLAGTPVIETTVEALQEAWQRPFKDW